jgi:hypothetical protein
VQVGKSVAVHAAVIKVDYPEELTPVQVCSTSIRK